MISNPSILVALQRGDLCGLFGKDKTTKEIPFYNGFILFIYFILPGLILCSVSLGQWYIPTSKQISNLLCVQQSNPLNVVFSGIFMT